MSNQNLKFIYIFRIIRPHQWVKNILVFTPMLMSHNFGLDNFILSINAFIIFSLIASSIYVINDIADIKSDQNHSFKRYRPLAAGLVTINQCKVLILILIILCSILLINLSQKFLLLIISYFTISNLYTFFFKKIIIFDLLTLSSLYTLRILGGGLVTNISVSLWLFSFSILFFICLASVKRLTELVGAENLNKQKIHGRGYKAENKKTVYWLAVSTGLLSVLVLILYVNSPQVTRLYTSPNILWLICFIMLFWILRIIYVSSKGKIKDDPIVYAINDKISYLCLFLILFIFWLGINI